MTPEPGMGTLNLTVCDREPIRVPGAIQPHGALLVIGVGDGVVRSASANAATVLGVEHALGLPLEMCSPALAAIVAVPREQSSAPRPGRLPMGPEAAFDVGAHPLALNVARDVFRIYLTNFASPPLTSIRQEAGNCSSSPIPGSCGSWP